MRIVSIGEGMIEMDQARAESPASPAPTGFAGEALATAWYLRRLVPEDWRIAFLTRLGMDEGSAALAAYLARSGLDCPPVPPDPRRGVGQYLLARDEGQRRFCHWLGDSAAHGLMREPAAVRQALDGADLVILGGDMLAVLPPAHRYALLALLAEMKRPLALIPASRLGLWPDASTARSVIGVAAALARIVLTTARAEAAIFHDASPLASAARYAKMGAGQVVVLQSEGRAVLALDGQMTTRPAEAAVSAPEGFNAGYLAAVLQGASPQDACALGEQVASRAIARRRAA
ncbi:MAG: 2-dehydro-3-deoxygluconokinase [Rhodobacteraceae bacterium PARR1]|nr:MAG: 2-dehydro-3-deoxygluconokinase [Rhodobacteraceae bacterium PARR1]